MRSKIRVYLTLALIRLAKKTCIYGFTYDHLVSAEEHEIIMGLHYDS